MRSFLAGECCSAFSPFGGICDQINIVSVSPNLCVTENVGLGITYFKITSSLSEESAMGRIIAPRDFSALLSDEQLDIREQARRDISLAFRSTGDLG